MNWELLVEIGNFAVGIIGVIGGTAGIIFWRAARKAQEAAAKEKETVTKMRILSPPFHYWEQYNTVFRKRLIFSLKML